MRYMRYLACFRPSEEIVDWLVFEENLTPPRTGFHCTIWTFHFLKMCEDEIIWDLLELNGSRFTTKIIKYDRTYGGLNVFVLEKPEKLQDLHLGVIKALRGFDESDERLNASIRRFGGDNYSPHITISRSPEFPGLRRDYRGLQIDVESYWLLKKKKDIWLNVGEFRLR